MKPMCILDRREIQLRKQIVVQVKVQWKHYSEDEATWEKKETMTHNIPALFQNFTDTD